MRLFLMIASVAMLLAPQSASMAAEKVLSDVERTAIEAGVRDSLKDPESARFSDLVAIDDDTMVSVCGFVNAKNSMGGYVGDTPFYGMLAGEEKKVFFVISLGGSEIDSKVTYEMCEKSGVKL